MLKLAKYIQKYHRAVVPKAARSSQAAKIKSLRREVGSARARQTLARTYAKHYTQMTAHRRVKAATGSITVTPAKAIHRSIIAKARGGRK
jgi:hypothetical protein